MSDEKLRRRLRRAIAVALGNLACVDEGLGSDLVAAEGLELGHKMTLLASARETIEMAIDRIKDHLREEVDRGKRGGT